MASRRRDGPVADASYSPPASTLCWDMGRTDRRPVGEVPIYPQNVYGATKCWGEALARVYGQDHALSCTARPSTRAISPKTPRMEASARGMRPIYSLPVSMPMKRAASILSMAPRATKTTGPGQFVGSTLGLRATGRHGVPPDIILGIYWTPVRCRKSDNCTGPHRFTPEP